MGKIEVKTLADLMRYAVQMFGEKTFLREKNRKDIMDTSFAKLSENSRKVSRFLSEYQEGKAPLHCAVIGGTSSAYLTAYFGTTCAGHVIVPLDAQMKEEDLCDHLSRADVQVFFYDSRYAPMLDAMKQNCSKIKVFVSLQDMPETLCLSQVLAAYTPLEQWQPLDPKQCAAILFTSGTTGKSKGVMLSHENLIDNTMCQDDESAPEEVLLTVLPIHHVYCFTCDILLSLRYGATVCVNDSMMHIVQNMKLFQPTMVLLVPMIAKTIYKKLQAASASNPAIFLQTMATATFGGKLKGLFNGGAYLSPDLVQAYLDLGIPIAQGYGMTECSPRISTGNLSDPCIGSVGTIVNGCTVKIVDGEIWAKSPSVMMGYYHNPEATAETLTENGWLKTGDLGYVDDQNHLYITGRKKNLIILSNGENVSPEELENKFSGLDWLSEVLVYAENGQITAEIYPNPDFVEKSGLDEVLRLFQTCVDQINRTVSGAKAIRQMRVRDIEFDKTTSKKIRREQSVQGKQIERRKTI
ncbi:MAG: AMP-binding protein [Ruminococcus sp.]|nr:AMP-binding protein [Ruminococcus sp.]